MRCTAEAVAAQPLVPCTRVKTIGVTALLAGVIVSILCVNTTIYVGPVSNWLSNADISWFAGPLVATLIYAIGTRHEHRSA